MTIQPKSCLHRRPPTFMGSPTSAIRSVFKFLIVGLSMGVASVAAAHDANVAAIRIVHHPWNAWVFELQTALHGLDVSMRRFHEERSRDLGSLTSGSTRYKELIIEYVKATFERNTDAVGATCSVRTMGSPLSVPTTSAAIRAHGKDRHRGRENEPVGLSRACAFSERRIACEEPSRPTEHRAPQASVQALAACAPGHRSDRLHVRPPLRLGVRRHGGRISH